MFSTRNARQKACLTIYYKTSGSQRYLSCPLRQSETRTFPHFLESFLIHFYGKGYSSSFTKEANGCPFHRYKEFIRFPPAYPDILSIVPYHKTKGSSPAYRDTHTPLFRAGIPFSESLHNLREAPFGSIRQLCRKLQILVLSYMIYQFTTAVNHTVSVVSCHCSHVSTGRMVNPSFSVRLYQ